MRQEVMNSELFRSESALIASFFTLRLSLDLDPAKRALYPYLGMWSLREEEVLKVATSHASVKGYSSG